MAINRYTKQNFPITLSWANKGLHTVKIENYLSSINVGTTQTLISATIGQNITQIDAQCFKNCYNLSSVEFIRPNEDIGTLGTKLDSIQPEAFMNCLRLSTINFNDKYVGTVGNSAFKHSGLLSIEISANLIDDSAFENCTNLSSIYLSCNTINNNICSADHNLLSAEIKTNTLYSNTFDKCSKLTNVKLTSNQLISSNMTFDNCYNLRDVQLSANDMSCTRMFNNCNALSSITLSVNSICMNYFNYGVYNNHLGNSGFNYYTEAELINSLNNYDGSKFAELLSVSENRPCFLNGMFNECLALEHIEFSPSLSSITINNSREIRLKYGNSSNEIPITSILNGEFNFPMFYNCKNLKTIKFNLLDDDDTENPDTEPINKSVSLYSSIFTFINSDHKLSVIFDDTFNNLDKRLTYNGNKNLTEIINQANGLGNPNGVIFIFKDSTFDPNAGNGLTLSFNDTDQEKIKSGGLTSSSVAVEF